jgi:hypothetical protein
VDGIIDVSPKQMQFSSAALLCQLVLILSRTDLDLVKLLEIQNETPFEVFIRNLLDEI